MNISTGRVVLIVLLTLAAGSTSAAGEAPTRKEPRKVIATAAATTRVKPDTAFLHFVVNTSEVPGKSAREANDRQVKTLREALAGLPLKSVALDIQVMPTALDSMVGPIPDESGTRVIQAKRARSTFSVTIHEKDLPKLREAVARIAEAVVDHGGAAPEPENAFPRSTIRLPRGLAGNEPPEPVRGPVIEWRSSNSGDARREAIRQATKDAIANAQAAVGDAPLTIAEIDVTSPEDVSFRLPSSLSNRSTEDATDVSIRIAVKVTCTY
ncbi:MAG: SIMPL domain-containing protein [Gemmataceae bacterium]